jgi:hypothetical protein
MSINQTGKLNLAVYTIAEIKTLFSCLLANHQTRIENMIRHIMTEYGQLFQWYIYSSYISTETVQTYRQLIVVTFPDSYYLGRTQRRGTTVEQEHEEHAPPARRERMVRCTSCASTLRDRFVEDEHVVGDQRIENVELRDSTRLFYAGGNHGGVVVCWKDDMYQTGVIPANILHVDDGHLPKPNVFIFARRPTESILDSKLRVMREYSAWQCS